MALERSCVDVRREPVLQILLNFRDCGVNLFRVQIAIEPCDAFRIELIRKRSAPEQT